MTNPVTSTDDESSRPAATLPARLDSAIEETSAGIGMMIADVVKRSLVGGVADIERTLADYVNERVESSIDAQMPVFAEAAHRVAESTSSRVVRTAVTESERRTREELQTAVSTIEQSVDQTRQAVDQTRQAIEETKAETQRKVEDTLQNLSQLTERSQSSWKRVKSQFEEFSSRIGQAETQLQAVDRKMVDLKTSSEASAQAAAQTVAESASRTASELRQALSQLAHKAEQDRLVAETGLQEANQRADVILQQCRQLAEQNRLLQQRVAELEKPKGLKAVWQKVSGRKKKSASQTGGRETADEEFDDEEE